MERLAVLFRRTPDTRPNPVKGGYTALAVFLPLIVLFLLGQKTFGALVMFGALLTAFGDSGSSSRRQKMALLVIAVGGALMTALGRLIGGIWWVEVVEMFLAVLFSGLLAVYGPAIGGVGLFLTISLVLSLSNPGGPATAGPAAAGFLLGGLIIFLFALVCARWQPDRVISGNEAQPSRARPTLSLLTSQFTWNSPLLRLSLLRALGAAVAALIGWQLGGPYPYWAALTVIICTRADQKTALVMALQNIVATLLGALVVTILVAAVPDALGLGLIVVAVTFLAFTVKEVNYTLHLFFLTTLILLLVGLGTGSHSLAAWRVLSIVIGAGIVLVVTLLNQVLFVVASPLPRPECQGYDRDR